ncbi:MAG: helix-turn-helix transcriptional regulator [Acidimicrobiia bacterium]|nr:helix-turn-helix transcriptional regulator [Acidimicrobiia bacterium]
MDDGTSAQIRDLVAAVTRQPEQLPVQHLVELAGSPHHDITLDLSDQPAVAYAKPRRHPAFGGLTQREAEVANLIAAGYSNRQLAEALFISVATVKDHVHAILHKTGFDSRAQITAAWLGAEI